MSAPSVSASSPSPVVVGAPRTGGVPPRDDDAALRQAARDMEAVFVQQLLKAMRETVPEGGLVARSEGEELFTGLMDERFAADTSAQWKRGLGDAIYRALRHRAGLDAPAAPSPEPRP